MSSLQKFIRNQPYHPRAADLNLMVEAARAKRDGRNQQRLDKSPLFRQSSIFKARNDSGAGRSAFDIIGINAPLHGPSGTGSNLEDFKRRTAFKGVAPTADHANVFGVYIEGTPEDEFGRAVFHGITPVKVDVTDTTHKFARAAAGVTGNLKSATHAGAQILWRQGGTGVQWAVVRIGNGPIGPVLARLATSIAGRAASSTAMFSGTATVQEINSSDEITPTAETWTVWNPTAMPMFAGALVWLVPEDRTGRWLIHDVLGATSTHVMIGAHASPGGLVINTAFLYLSAAPLYVTMASALPVWWNFGTAQLQISRAGIYPFMWMVTVEQINAVHNGGSFHGYSKIGFRPHFNATPAGGAEGFATFDYPAGKTIVEAHAHTFTDSGGDTGPTDPTSIELEFTSDLQGRTRTVCGVGLLQVASGGTIDIRPTTFATNVAVPAADVIANYQAIGGGILIMPGGAGDLFDAWT